MTIHRYSLSDVLAHTLPWLVLAVLLIYTYAKFFEHPYSGFRPSPEGEVIYIFVEQDTQPALLVKDRLIQIESLLWDEFIFDDQKLLFENVQPGEIVPLVIQRAGQEVTIPWKYPGPNQIEILDLLVSEGWLAYVFWLVGTITLLNLRPKDEIWWLMIAFSYLTAIWLTVGSGVSFYHIWGSPLILRASIWFWLPVFLHLHWSLPRRLFKIPRSIIIIVYVMAGILAVLEWFHVLPRNLYLIGFLLAVIVGFFLLFAHFVFQPEVRSNLRLLTIVGLLAFLPAIALGVIAVFIEMPGVAGWGLVGLPLLPIAYLYGAYRRRLGRLELRVNHFFSIYFFGILLLIAGLPFIALLDHVVEFPGKVLVIALMAAVFTAAAFIWGYPAFEDFVERRILGIPLPSKHLLETYSTQITTSVSLSDLIRVLQEKIFPSLLIRQSAFLQLDQGSMQVFSSMGLREVQMPKEQDVPYLMTQSGVYRSPDLVGPDRPFPWARLILPLQLGDQWLGLWLFGRRDPDDMYSQLEIPILNSLANLTAIALSNILQTERLKSMYEMNISRYEQERLRLAHDLHDSILNELAALLTSPDAPDFSPKFQQAFDELTERLREIVNDLRPPMLAFGLKLALESFAENLIERNQNSVEVVADIQADGDWRYPEVVENNLYRIVQQSCENALRHAHSKTITIFGRLHQEKIDIRVEDDGIGFDSEISLKLDRMLVEKHFGLIGMLERANLIGAEMSVHSKPNQGTKIQVFWKSKETI
jgi:signal transduction histidine kinase